MSNYGEIRKKKKNSRYFECWIGNVFKKYSLNVRPKNSKGKFYDFLNYLEVLLPNKVQSAATPKVEVKFEKPAVSVGKISQELTIVGVRPAKIIATRTELMNFCYRESASGSISGKEYSDIIKSLSASQACYFQQSILLLTQLHF